MIVNHPLNGKMIYQVFVRNHSRSGDFNGLINDLSRIKDLGCDYLYLMPIHPISQYQRKGTLGSSYAIADYYAINPEYGSLEDFKLLLTHAHALDMKVWMDIVINHTGADHYYLTQHPEFYYRKADGRFGNKVGEWWDIVDLDFTCPQLQEELLKMLVYWVQMGVDGYRCDVASLIPMDFWRKADQAVKQINPDHIWFAESIHGSFVRYLREHGIAAHSDGELYEVFDIEYDYDVHLAFLGYLQQHNHLVEYKRLIAQQEYIYPVSYVKAHFIENHDQQRIHHLTGGNLHKTINWLAFSFIAKGIAFVYAGQECLAQTFVNQFDSCPILWDSNPLVTNLIKQLKTIKQMDCILLADRYVVDVSDHEALVLYYYYGEQLLCGIFNVGQVNEVISLELPAGDYFDLLSQQSVTIMHHQYNLGSQPVILINKQ
jgi:glycosidase